MYVPFLSHPMAQHFHPFTHSMNTRWNFIASLTSSTAHSILNMTCIKLHAEQQLFPSCTKSGGRKLCWLPSCNGSLQNTQVGGRCSRRPSENPTARPSLAPLSLPVRCLLTLLQLLASQGKSSRYLLCRSCIRWLSFLFFLGTKKNYFFFPNQEELLSRYTLNQIITKRHWDKCILSRPGHIASHVVNRTFSIRRRYFSVNGFWQRDRCVWSRLGLGRVLESERAQN